MKTLSGKCLCGAPVFWRVFVMVAVLSGLWERWVSGLASLMFLRASFYACVCIDIALTAVRFIQMHTYGEAMKADHRSEGPVPAD